MTENIENIEYFEKDIDTALIFYDFFLNYTRRIFLYFYVCVSMYMCVKDT